MLACSDMANWRGSLGCGHISKLGRKGVDLGGALCLSSELLGVLLEHPAMPSISPRS